MVVYFHINKLTVRCIQDVHNFSVYVQYIAPLFPYIAPLFRLLILPNYNRPARLACRAIYISLSLCLILMILNLYAPPHTFSTLDILT